jgi:hypothetical protein
VQVTALKPLKYQNSYMAAAQEAVTVGKQEPICENKSDEFTRNYCPVGCLGCGSLRSAF